MQSIEVYGVELSQNLQELQAQTQHYYLGFYFFIVWWWLWILVETPSYTRQCVARVFMDCKKDFNEKTLCIA